MKRSLLFVAVLMLLLLAACQPVSDARSQACNSMREAATQATEIKTAVLESKPVQTVAQLRESVVRPGAREVSTPHKPYTPVITSTDNVAQLTCALNQIEADLQGVPDATPGIGTCGPSLSDSATAVSTQRDRFCTTLCALRRSIACCPWEASRSMNQAISTWAAAAQSETVLPWCQLQLKARKIGATCWSAWGIC